MVVVTPSVTEPSASLVPIASRAANGGEADRLSSRAPPGVQPLGKVSEGPPGEEWDSVQLAPPVQHMYLTPTDRRRSREHAKGASQLLP